MPMPNSQDNPVPDAPRPRTRDQSPVGVVPDASYPALVVRGVIGGALMGLANLVPGISGGTMLLASGVYPRFVNAIAELTTLRFRPRSIVALGAIGCAAALAIVLLAGPIRALVIDHRWVMYSIFIGLTLGGAPLVWRLARPVNASVYIAAACGFACMLAMAFIGPPDAGDPGSRNYLMLALAGLAGASAMILPGVSGAYLLLLLGQYVPILGAIDLMKTGLLGDSDAGTGRDFALVLEAMHVVVPVGVGVVIGIVGVSNLIKWLLTRFEKPTLGALLGLLLGAVAGLWPFRAGVEPQPGDVVKGRVLTPETIAALDRADWPLQTFTPTPTQALIALALIATGFGATLLLGRLTREGTKAPT